ncbi:MAG: hypothetical protein N2512_10600, partial [Armatimonadetes bacterium]|nr:hypothetical protein [Armatimonadota bacterium]
MSAHDFLAGCRKSPGHVKMPEGMTQRGLFLGQGDKAAEVVVAVSPYKPSPTVLREMWLWRQAQRGVPLVVVVLHGERASVCGPSGDHPPVYEDVDAQAVERICRRALDQPNRHDALRFLWDRLPHLEAALPGVRNEGFLTLYELQRLPSHQPPLFAEATAQAQQLMALRGEDLLSGLGFTVEPIRGRAYRLLAGQRRRAVAVLLEAGEAWELPDSNFYDLSPVSCALVEAERENVPYVVLLREGTLRLHPVEDGLGVAQRGRVDTFLEIDLDLLAPDKAGYLWMLFSAEALSECGYLEQILDRARDHALAVGTRLRQRIYEDVVPRLALALWQARKAAQQIEETVEELRKTYEMALTVLFRILFIAYAEDKELLPYRTNEAYRRRSLKRMAHELYGLRRDRTPLSAGTSYWDEVCALWQAVDQGRPEWGVPAYDGQLFSSCEEVCPAGAAINAVKLENKDFVPILQNLLIDEAPGEGFVGPVDFGALGVREFGTIYEGLLENELAIAKTDLTTRRIGDREVYWPVAKPTRRGAEIKVRKNEAYLHDASGARKSTGSYFTKDFAVSHLLDHALEPALDAHLERLDGLDDAAAARAFFDFRVADIAMGSGHFLVAAIDRIEHRLAAYLSRRPLQAVRDELHRLKQAAQDALLGPGQELNIEDSQLLRRQIARRCIYGVDINPLAVQLARVSIWIHTFVPGLPLSFLDHNL